MWGTLVGITGAVYILASGVLTWSLRHMTHLGDEDAPGMMSRWAQQEEAGTREEPTGTPEEARTGALVGG
jgi:hypothetical protein